MKHTMGPWKVVEQDIYTHVAHNELGFRIANVFNQSSGGEFAKEEVKANAHLIAAAPEMLHLVEVLLNVTVNAVDPNDFSDIRKQCRAVLAKARGES